MSLKPAEQIALNTYLSRWPSEWIFPQIMQGLANGNPLVEIWEPYEGWDKHFVAINILDLCRKIQSAIKNSKEQ